jgi:capsid protein
MSQRASGPAGAFRAAHPAPMAIAGSWEGASTNRLSGRSSTAMSASADAHRDPWTMRRMGANVEDALRKQAMLRMVASALVRLVVGPEPDVIFKSSSPEFNAIARKWFEKARESKRFDYRRMATLGGMAATTLLAILDGGRIGWLKVDDGSVQAIESARICNPSSVASTDLAIYRDGVRVNEQGRPIGYHIGRWGRTQTFVDPSGGITVGYRDLLYLVNPHLPKANATTSEPLLATAIEWIDSVSFAVSAINAAHNNAASIATIWTHPEPTDFADGMGYAKQAQRIQSEDGEGGQTTDVQYRQTELGWEVIGPEGMTATQVRSEHPNADLEWYFTWQIRVIAASLDMPLEAVMFLFNQSYTAHRAAFATAWPAMERWQNWLEYDFLRHVVRHALAADIRTGAVKLGGVKVPEDWREIEFILPPMPVFDKKEEVEAAILMVNGNFSTLEDETRKLTGRDSSEVLKKRAAEVAEQKRLGIEPPQMPGSKTSEEGKREEEGNRQ